ncbi:MAG: hypothetical protein AAFN11_18510 [Chloroflexota bacterium]
MALVSYKAESFVAPEGSEIIGLAVRANFTNLVPEIWNPILEKYDLKASDIDDNAWYPYQLALDLTRQVANQPGGQSALVANGKSIAENLNTDEIKDIEDFLTVWMERIVKSALRNIPDDMGYIVEKVDDQHFRVASNIPADNDTIYGYMWESCRRLVKAREKFTVRPVSGYPGNKERAVFEVKWG